jgi:hypothetical protein
LGAFPAAICAMCHPDLVVLATGSDCAWRSVSRSARRHWPSGTAHETESGPAGSGAAPPPGAGGLDAREVPFDCGRGGPPSEPRDVVASRSSSESSLARTEGAARDARARSATHHARAAAAVRHAPAMRTCDMGAGAPAACASSQVGAGRSASMSASAVAGATRARPTVVTRRAAARAQAPPTVSQESAVWPLALSVRASGRHVGSHCACAGASARARQRGGGGA